MPPRDSQLPEGTDHIINGAMETGAGTGASTGSSATGGTSGTGGGSSSGFIGGAGVTVSMGDDTGGTASGGYGGGSKGSSGGGSSSGGSSGATGKIAGQVREQVQGLKSQATDKVRQYADQGKERADSVLDNFNQVVQDAARSVDERLGAEYGQYAHRAADAVSSLAEGLRAKSVDDLLNDSRDVIRKSPGLAIGAAALIGFALTRVVKAGIPSDDNDVDFTPDRQLTDRASTGSRSTTGTGTTTGRTTTGAGV
nr:hypothetical protein [uncultured Sphingosinicella sp.]